MEVLGEIDMLRTLSHPNIIGYHETFTEDRYVCIAMEYADGGDLSEAIELRRSGRASGSNIASQGFQEREAMAIFVQITLAVQYMHSCRVLHRDLKSQNIFLTGAGIVKVGDFGIAKALRASRRCAETQIGSPYYMPPEICENRPYGFKADVWCLGVVLYELLALEVPFSANSIAALAIKIVIGEPKPVPAIYGGETRTLLKRLLSKRADDRPTIDEIAVLPHVRRSICALGATSSSSSSSSGGYSRNLGHGTGDASSGGYSRNPGHGTGEVKVEELALTTGSSTAAAATLPVAFWAIPTPMGHCPVDLAEVENLLGVSPTKRPRPRSTPTPHKNSATCSLSLELAELEVLLDIQRTLKVRTPQTNCTDLSFAACTDEGACRSSSSRRSLRLDTSSSLLASPPVREAAAAAGESGTASITCSCMLRDLEADFARA
jgi:serine/threonine protein kinase